MIKIFVLFSALLVSFSAFTQQYNFIRHSIEEGLVQSQVRAICQDEGGYLWLGTFGGVSRFDGISFQNFSTNDGLLDNIVYSIHADSNGDVIIGSKGGFNRYSGGEWSVFRFKENLEEYYVHSIVEDEKNNLWFGLEQGWLVKLKDGELSYMKTNKGDINDLFCDKDNNIWISATNGVAVLDQEFKLKDSIQGVNVSQVYIEDNVLCYSTFQDGVHIINQGNQTHLSTQEGLLSDNVRGFIKSSNGDYWFYTSGGLTRYRNGELKKFSEKEGLQSNNIRSLIEDREGNLFIGTDGMGFVKFTGDRFMSYTTQDGLNNDIILSITEDQYNNLWFGSNGGGVSMYDGNDVRNFNTNDGLTSNTVWSILKLTSGNVLFGTGNGISSYDGKEFKDFFWDKDNPIWSLYEDHIGNIWAGTTKGLLYFDNANDKIINYSKIGDINKNVKSIIAVNADEVWFCSDNGIHQYSYSKRKFTWLSQKDGLPDNFIMSAVKDLNGTIWVGTSNGLAYFKNNKFHEVNFSDVQGDNFITFLNVDKDNNLWIGSMRGLFKLSITKYKELNRSDFIYYSNLDGLIGLECNQNSVFIDSENDLWFGTSNGLMRFDLEKQDSQVDLPIVHLQGVRLFFEDIDLLDYAESVNPRTGLPVELKFKHNQDHLTFDFIGISHSKSLEVNYQFKLEGNDEDWSPLSMNTYVTYSNLAFGNYSFFLKASNDNKNWTEPLRFDFTIVPPFYFRIWFFMLCFVFIVGSIWIIAYRRRQVLKRRKETQLILDQSKMLKLEHQALNASMNRHFIFNALNSIQYYINRQDKLAANKYLSSFAKLVRKNLDSSLVNEVVLEEEIERIDLYLKLEQMRFKEKFAYKISVDPDIEQQALKIPPMLLQPFVENSIIHGILPLERFGYISVIINQDGDELTIDIQDDGVGIDNSLKMKQSKKHSSGEVLHFSKGMMLVQERIELVSKMSNKRCFIDGPNQRHDNDGAVLGTAVSIHIRF